MNESAHGELVQLRGGRVLSTPSAVVAKAIQWRYAHLSQLAVDLITTFTALNPDFGNRQAAAFGEAVCAMLLQAQYEDTTEEMASMVLGMAWVTTDKGNCLAWLYVVEAGLDRAYIDDFNAVINTQEMHGAGYLRSDRDQEWRQLKHVLLLLWIAVYPGARKHFGGSDQQRKTAR